MTTTTQHPLRWLVAAPLSQPPSGRLLDITDALEQLGFTATVDLGPALGAAGPLAATIAFPRLRAFSITAVIAATPPLAELAALSERLNAPPSKRPAPAELLAAVARVAGEGPLHAELAALFAPAPATPTPAAPAPSTSSASSASDAATGASLVDDLLDQPVHIAPAPTRTDRPTAIIDAIVRSNTPAPAPRDTSANRAARDRLDTALAAAARAALADPAVVARESLWRALKLLHEQAPRAPGPRVSVIDIGAQDLPEVLARLAEEAAMDLPDAVFVAEPLASLELLPELAARAADLLVPVVLTVTPQALGAADLGALQDLPDAPTQIPEVWTTLRADEDSRWLAAAVNPVALVSEGIGAARRVVFGSPALALATLLSASHRDNGGLASLARVGVVHAPAVWEPAAGPDAGMSIPTERFASLRIQGRLSMLGLTAIGSPRGGDSLVVAACPVLRASDDAGSLPAQILTGRIVRFATTTRDQLTAGSTPAEVENLFTRAAGVVLFPDLTPELASLVARVDDSRTSVELHAIVHPAIAGLRLEIQFALPIKVDLG